MNPKENSPITVQTLLTLRQESDALRLITEKLQVKEMGPSDHIRTKHEAKAFVETGDVKAAEALIKQASERTAAHQAISQKITQQQGQRP
jgi:thioredoxin-like negative regulator of GroEL